MPNLSLLKIMAKWMKLNKILYAFCILFLSSLVNAENKVIRLTSLEWPPYSGKDLPQQGSSVAIARKAFAAMGYTLEVTFFPWSRAVALAKDKNSQFAGYFPEYYAQDTAEQFIYSKEIGSGPLGFAERIDNSISWSTLTDLAPYDIGIVQDYINTKDFDVLARSNALTTSITINDTNNLKKLVSSRIDLAVVDKNVMEYLFTTDPSLMRKAHLAQFNKQLLEEKKLYICFKKTERGQQYSELLSQGLQQISVDNNNNK
jgi:polar amino acid transport system substrate-binding protein